MDVIKTHQVSARPIEKVVVQPLVLLSIDDNYNCVAKDTRKRVVSVLLGSSFKGTVDVSNSYAVPFEEDDKDSSIWFLDMRPSKEHVVGWYSTDPKLRENDLNIHALFGSYVPNHMLVIIDVQPKELGIPTKAYCTVEEVKEVTGKLSALKGLDAQLKKINFYSALSYSLGWRFPMAGVMSKFCFASLFMWMTPIAILYGFNHSLFPV